MSNNFPSIPTDFGLFQLTYMLNLPGLLTSNDGTFNLITDVSGTGAPSAYPMEFQFNTPGTVGTFDQTTFESDIVTAVTALCQSIADVTGETLAEVQAQTSIGRTWQFASASNFAWQATFTDTVPFPPAS
jgi:hypothetical protein